MNGCVFAQSRPRNKQNLEAVPKLSEMLENASPMVVFRIIEALGRIGGNVAFSVLLSMADNEDQKYSGLPLMQCPQFRLNRSKYGNAAR